MKKIITTMSLLVIVTLNSFVLSQSPNNVRLYPKEAELCAETELYVWIAGQSLIPTSYQWSTGETTATIKPLVSGTYTVTVTGYAGNPNNTKVHTKWRTYSIIQKPKIIPLTNTWVCKFDTVRLTTTPGYDYYQWHNGFTGTLYERPMTLVGGPPQLDTVSVWYTAGITGKCEFNSDTIILRGMRFPKGVGNFYCGQMSLNINDSVPPGLILEYLYPVSQEMEFTQVSDTSIKITHFTVLGNQMAPLNILQLGETYYVRSRPIINNQIFCWGDTCLIGILPTPSMKEETVESFSLRNSNNEDVLKSDVKIFKVYDLQGHYLFEKTSNVFDKKWMNGFSKGYYVVVTFRDNIAYDSYLIYVSDFVNETVYINY